MRELSRVRLGSRDLVMLGGAMAVVWGFTRNSMVGWFLGAVGLIPLLFPGALASFAKKRMHHS